MALDYKDITFLLVDENDRMRRITRNVLERIGYENILEAGSGEIALETLQNSKVDLVICEAVMNEMPGMDVLRTVRDNDEFQATAFIMISAEKDHAVVAEAGEGDVDAYVLKPFTVQFIQDKIRQVMDFRRTPSPLKIHLDLGLVYVQNRQYDQAYSEFEKALDINPNSPRVLMALGKVKESTGRLDEAMQLYHKAVKLSPQFIKGYDALAAIYEGQGDLETAARYLKQAAVISPRNAERQIRLGQALIKTGNKHDATKVLNLAMKVAKESCSKIVRQIGDAYIEAGMMEEAQGILVEGLALNPKDLHLYNRLGIAYRKQKKFREAMKNYEQALKIDVNNENLYYNLGRACHDAGEWDKSAEAMKKALEIYPDFEEAKIFIKQVLKV